MIDRLHQLPDAFWSKRRMGFMTRIRSVRLSHFGRARFALLMILGSLGSMQRAEAGSEGSGWTGPRRLSRYSSASMLTS